VGDGIGLAVGVGGFGVSGTAVSVLVGIGVVVGWMVLVGLGRVCCSGGMGEQDVMMIAMIESDAKCNISPTKLGYLSSVIGISYFGDWTI